MRRLVIQLYDIFSRYPRLAWGGFIVLTVCLTWSFSTLRYQEDISDFLPLDATNQTALEAYQEVSGANKIYAIFSLRDASVIDRDMLAEGIDSFVDEVERLDTLGGLSRIVKQIDLEQILEQVGEATRLAPYFLTETDYDRIDSLLSTPGYINRQLAADKQMLLFPSSQIAASSISRDPLNLFSPLTERLRSTGEAGDFETYDGYIMSADGRRAVVILESAYGSRESQNNGMLVSMLHNALEQTLQASPDLDIHLIGGPVIAATNASQIKRDSMLAVAVAAILIVALLIYVFRNVRSIALILLSVGWGWLFTMGIIALFYDSVSIIVVGIASIIIGIAVNYPLHMIDHFRESSDPHTALKEIVSPLVVGNVTTVGAFLCLVPLNAPALHDLGLFASLQLVGTILFVLIFLPHLIKTRGEASAVEPKLITRIARLKLPDNRWVVIGVVILTIVLGYFSLQTEFDTDMRNINYMTDRQRADMAFFGEMTREASDAEQLYIVGDGAVWEDALAQSAAIAPLIDSLERHSIVMRRNAVRQFLPTTAQQQQRLERWRRFVASFDDYAAEFAAASAREGFSPNAFSDFQDLLHEQYNVRSFESFRPFLATLFPTNMAGDSASTRKRIIEVLTVPTDYVDSVRSLIAATPSFNGIVFDVSTMNGSIANTLSDDFNYIGFACGAVVFLFLWLSLGRIELALISFLPMAVSWIWILGLMGLMGIKFNIVNVILATFIFGQGDDYTIFMTEGLSYEYAYRRKLLDSYKNSIIVSSLIMFIGIGTLMLAKHPALRSLGEVTVVGMISVVLTACLFPPMLFGWLIRLKDYRRRSLDAGFSELVAQVGRLYRYKGADVERTARRRLKTLAEAETELTALPAEEAILVDEVDGQGEAALLLVMLYPKRTIYICQYSADAEALLDGCLDEIGASLHRVTPEALAELHVSTHAPLLHIQRKTIKIR